MKKSVLLYDQTLVLGEEKIPNELILKMYFRIFYSGHGDDLPPAIITRTGNIPEITGWLESNLVKWEKEHPSCVGARRREYAKIFSAFEKTPYLLIDGNHRTAAAFLARQSISALEVERDEDLDGVRNLVKSGELFNFKRMETSLFDLRRGFVGYCLNLRMKDDFDFMMPMKSSSCLRYVGTIKEKIEEMVQNKEFPSFILQNYAGNKT